MSHTHKLFALGHTATTPGVINLLGEDAHLIIWGLLQRHAAGDWGTLDREDRQANDQALQHGDRILSSYRVHWADLPTEARVWIITEADRSRTTVLLPEEY